MTPRSASRSTTRFQKIVAEEVPFLYVMYWNWFHIFTKRIKGLPKTALVRLQLYRKANQWWIE